LSFTLGSDFASSRAVTTGSPPRSAAPWSGVRPSLSVAFTSAPALISNSTTSGDGWNFIALCSGVSPASFKAATSTF
jgi:hypothetical protein